MGETDTVRETCACTTFWKNKKNLNCPFYPAQAKELGAQYADNVCTLIALGIYYIWRYGVADIQMPAPVGSKHNMDN